MRVSNGRALVVIVLGLLVLLSLAARAEAQSTGILEGQVVNGTAGGPDAGGGLLVTLHVLQGDAEVDTLESTTDAGGRFRFEGLDTEAGLEYWPEVFYQDVGYSSAEPYQFDGGQTTLDASVAVYETTAEDSGIRLDSVHMIVESFGEVLRISEIHLLGNSGDRTYVGGKVEEDERATVFIPLPEQAVGLAFEDDESGERFVETEDGVWDTEPVPPGPESSLLFFSYHLMVTGETVTLERRFAYPVANLSMLVAQPGLTLRSDQLLMQGTELFQGRQYEFHVGQGLGPDQPLSLEFTLLADEAGSQEPSSSIAAGGQPSLAGASTRGNQELLLWLGLALSALVVLGAAIYPVVTRPPASVSATALDLTTDPKGRRLVAELADLEEAFEAGEVDKVTYERQWTEISDRLKSLQQ
jgi:hypothetical protein